MSKWQTVSVKHMDGSTESFQRYTSNGKNPRVRQFFIGSKGCGFYKDEFWMCHDVGDAYLVSISDTSDGGYIRNFFIDQELSVTRHKESLWTADVHPGPSFDWKTDVLAELPDWVKVGGNWSYMDNDE